MVSFLCREFHFRAGGLVLAAALLASGCAAFYRYDLPKGLMNAPSVQVWAVSLSRSDSQYRVTATTRLNGDAPLHEKARSLLASGADGDWQWRVIAVPSLLKSWTDWEGEKRNLKIRREALDSGNWFHSAMGWDLAFQRAHRVARYLLGHPPLSLHATVLLVPDGVNYDQRVTDAGKDYFPLTLAFYWPSSKRPTAFIGAITRTMYEYQHLLVDSGAIPPVGNDAADREANDEARSQCWSDSTFLALVAGTSSSMQWNVSAARAALALLDQSNQSTVNEEQGKNTNAPQRGAIRFSDAYAWGRLFEVESVAAYLQKKGNSAVAIRANQLAEANAVFSVCQAMTQHPLDLVSGAYPPSHVRFSPFFPQASANQESQ